MTSFVEKNVEIFLEKISLLSGITIEKAQMYSNALKSSDVSWYCDTFGMMHRFSCTLYRPISSYKNKKAAKNVLLVDKSNIAETFLTGKNQGTFLL